jgi:hypothetical protein
MIRAIIDDVGTEDTGFSNAGAQRVGRILVSKEPNRIRIIAVSLNGQQETQTHGVVR